MIRTYGSFRSTVAAATLFVIPVLAAEPRYTGWSEPVNLGPIVNTPFEDFGPAISRDGLSLYFHSGRPGGFGGTDIWVSRRATHDHAWGPPENLGSFVNTEFNENTPKLSLDGHRLYFASNRPGGFGGSDIYVSRRRHENDDLGWRLPQNVGSGVNSPANEGGPAPFEDDASGINALYFFSTRPGGFGAADIYESALRSDDTFGPSLFVPELSSPAADIVPNIRRDGLEVFITSNRQGSLPLPPPITGLSFDLWVSTRGSTGDSWSVPVNLGVPVNSDLNDGWAAVSFDGTILYFSTGRSDTLGGLDIYTTTRTKVR